MSNSIHSNQFIAARQRMASTGFVPNGYSGGRYNQSWGDTSRNMSVNSIKVFKNRIGEGRSLRYDDNGDFIDVVEDECCEITSVAHNLIGLTDAYTKNRVAALFLRVGDDPDESQQIMDLFSGVLTANMTMGEAVIVARVIAALLQKMNIQSESVHDFLSRGQRKKQQQKKPTMRKQLFQDKAHVDVGPVEEIWCKCGRTTDAVCGCCGMGWAQKACARAPVSHVDVVPLAERVKRADVLIAEVSANLGSYTEGGSTGSACRPFGKHAVDGSTASVVLPVPISTPSSRVTSQVEDSGNPADLKRLRGGDGMETDAGDPSKVASRH